MYEGVAERRSATSTPERRARPSARKRLKQLLAELDEIPDSFIADICCEIELALRVAQTDVPPDYVSVEPCLEATDVHGDAGTEKRWRFMEHRNLHRGRCQWLTHQSGQRADTNRSSGAN